MSVGRGMRLHRRSSLLLFVLGHGLVLRLLRLGLCSIGLGLLFRSKSFSARFSAPVSAVGSNGCGIGRRPGPGSAHQGAARHGPASLLPVVDALGEVRVELIEVDVEHDELVHAPAQARHSIFELARLYSEHLELLMLFLE